jgi:energy-coupling factor transporter ATP-binding protein EcfA2
MRLRYLHLPRCGPLTDTAVVFGRDELIAKALNLPRKGSLNFVVGVNGSGKSSLLRALYRIFRALKIADWPDLPVSMAWDIEVDGTHLSTVLHYSNVAAEQPFIAVLRQVSRQATKSDWSSILHALGTSSTHPLVEILEVEIGAGSILNPPRRFRLPKNMIAYSSGDDAPWLRLEHRDFKGKDEDEGQYQTEDERQLGWSMDQEWEREQPGQTAELLKGFTPKIGDLTHKLPSPAWKFDDVKMSDAFQFIGDFRPINEVRKKLWSNQQIRTERLDDSYFRIQSRHLRFAGITMAVCQAAKEMAGRTEERHREALRSLFIQRLGCDGKPPTDGRLVLNAIDWFWPTHISFTYRDADDRVSSRQHQELLCLAALAEEVVAQPRGRNLAVFSLGPSDRINLTEKLKDAFSLGIPSKALEFIAERVDGCKTGAEALLRLFSADQEIDSTPMDVFTRLRDWERTGLLEDITLTVKRIHRPEFPDGEPDDIVVSYDQLSDGEQMLLGRMGLLFLLRGQNGSLLLLDEPETHFNDVWKREIVEMVNMGLLNSTDANVIVATHTSIALTDAFAAEVTVLDKKEGETTARGVKGGLFGTDPGEVNMNLFHADSSIGRRSDEILAQLLKTEWKGREAELEAILNVLGSSFHRAELRAILKRLKATTNGAAST